MHKVPSEDGKEVLLYRHSEGREEKESAMVARFATAFEAGLQKLADGHLFITVLACQCVQALRTQLKAAGIDGSWATLMQTLSIQHRVTTTLQRKNGRAVHVRKSTLAEPDLEAIYRALAINPAPGGTKKMIL